jgi:heme/copper-type cytochrome/quinol oxidase subunit 2
METTLIWVVLAIFIVIILFLVISLWKTDFERFASRYDNNCSCYFSYEEKILLPSPKKRENDPDEGEE